jgi:hypothetical protein
MTDNQRARMKAEILKVAKELLAENPDDTSVLYEMQDFIYELQDLMCEDMEDEGPKDGEAGFDDGSVYTIEQIKNS